MEREPTAREGAEKPGERNRILMISLPLQDPAVPEVSLYPWPPLQLPAVPTNSPFMLSTEDQGVSVTGNHRVLTDEMAQCESLATETERGGPALLTG